MQSLIGLGIIGLFFAPALILSLVRSIELDRRLIAKIFFGYAFAFMLLALCLRSFPFFIDPR